jgi:hypothetical protein
MNRMEEAQFERKAEQHFRGHRDAPKGRSFLSFVERFHGGNVKRNYDIGICRTFPTSPGSFMCGACKWDDCELRKET